MFLPETPEDALTDQLGSPEPVVLTFAPPISLTPSPYQPTSSTRLILDERAIARLMGLMIKKSGLSIQEVADQMGISKKGVEKRVYGERVNPPIAWLLKLAAITGSEITVNFAK